MGWVMFGEVVVILGAYLLGSLSSAVLVCRSLGCPDPRSCGSGNPGATNVLRLVGKKAAALTLLGDALKGFLPVWLGQELELPPLILSLILLASFLGHLFPIFFQFKGGKGVATAFGGLLALSWQAGLAVVLIWILCFAIFRISSLAGLLSTITAPFLVYYFYPHHIAVATVSLIALIIIWRHRSNIAKLLRGEEGKMGQP